MRVPINREDSLPIYQQITSFIRGEIISGALPPGTRLPSSRQMAAHCGVSRITVLNVYSELTALGLIQSSPGDGTYVAPPLPDVLDVRTVPGQTARPAWQDRMLQPGPRSAAEQFDQLKAASIRPGLISFAEGNTDSSLFPLADFRRTLNKVMKENGPEALAYGESAGYAPLRTTIARYLSGQGIPAHPEQILVTAGSQQAISLVLRLLLHPGDAILAESPTHMTFIDLCQVTGLRILSVPIDEHGMQVEKAEAVIQAGQARLIYTVPNFQNPSGACLSLNRRRQLIKLAVRYNIPILEDDFVGELRYKGTSLPALKALDPGGYVIHVSTFSKMLMPSLRIGFLVADGALYERLLDLRHACDVTSSNLIQRALHAYLNVGRYEDCLRRGRKHFARRLNAMQAALEKHMPPGVTWTHPQGGLFIWLSLPPPLTAGDLLPEAIQSGVIYAPGSLFYPLGTVSNSLRLNFSEQPPERIEPGIRRLARVIRSHLPDG